MLIREQLERYQRGQQEKDIHEQYLQLQEQIKREQGVKNSNGSPHKDVQLNSNDERHSSISRRTQKKELD